MPKDFSTMEDSNRCPNPSIHDISQPSRRTLLRGAAASAFLAPLAGLGLAGCAATGGNAGSTALGFKAVPISNADTVTVPEGYTAQVIAPWGDPVGLSGENPAYQADATNTAAEQEAQFGMHHDGIHFYAQSTTAGLLVMNHEYTDDGLLHAGGMAPWTAEKVRKAQAAHGVSVCEVALKNGRWDVVRPSPWARRITARTPMAVSGPAAGHALLKTPAAGACWAPSTTAAAAPRPGAPT
jgi:secreted PhoX family phosphatase